MTPIADMVRRLINAGCDAAEAAATLSEAYAAGVHSTRIQVDEAAEKRRAWDREYRRKLKAIPPESTRIPPDQVERHIYEKKVSKTHSIRGTRIPPEWELPPETRSWAQQQGLSDSEIDSEVPRFKDWWGARSGKDATKADWSATFRNWIRNFLERKGRTSAGDPPPVVAIGSPEYHARIAAYHAKYSQPEKANGEGHETALDGNGIESSNHASELFPPR